MMKKLLAMFVIAALALTGAALAATYTDPERDLTFDYDDSLFEITLEDADDESIYVGLAGRDPAWGSAEIYIYLADMDEGESFPTVEAFSEMGADTGTEVVQAEWNGFRDTIMFKATLGDDLTESMFIIPIYDDDEAEIEKKLTVRIDASDADNPERDDAINAVLATLKVLDD